MIRNIVLASVLGILIPAGNMSARENAYSGTITLSGSWAIYPAAVAWAEAFQKKYPGVKVDVGAGGAGKGAADAIAGLADIGMVSREPDPAEISRGIVPVCILQDAVYPVVSDRNPVLPELLEKGISKKIWAGLYAAGTVRTWDAVVNRKVNKPVHIYTRSDSCGAASSWAAYLGIKQEDLKGVGVYGDPGLLEAAKRDPAGIGYANFSYVFTREGALIKGAKLVPIDSNENGIADPDEVYADRKSAVRALRAGRYPAARKNYFFIKAGPTALVKEFIRFALSAEGTKIVDETGASLPLKKSEREIILRTVK